MSEEVSPTEKDEPSRPRAFQRSALEELRTTLEHADAGTLASLRRMLAPELPHPAFFRIASKPLDEILPDHGSLRERLESRWAICVQAMAMAITPSKSGRSSLLSRVPFGEALALGDVAEMRVLRLLNAPDDHVAPLVRNAVHQLVSRGQSFDPQDLASLVLSEGDHKESARRRIARDFYRHFNTE